MVDFTDRANVKTLAKLDTGVSPYEGRTRFKLMADGRHVMITGNRGAAIVDISDLSAPAKVGATINTGVLTGSSDVGQILVLEEYALVVGDLRVATIGIKDLTNPKVMKPVSFEGEGRGQFGAKPGRLVAIGNMHFLLVSSHGVYVLKMTAGGAQGGGAMPAATTSAMPAATAMPTATAMPMQASSEGMMPVATATAMGA